MGMGKACLLLCLSVNLLNHAALECQGVRTVSYAQTIKARVRMISEPWSKTASSPAPNSFQFVFPYLSRVAPRAVRELHNERMLPRQRSSTDESSLALDTPLASDFNPTFDGPGEKDGGGFPPDDAIAAGPNYLVTAINALVGIYDKSGNRIGSLQQMVSFFGSLGLSGSYSDPRVLYDATAGRFIVVDDLVGLPSCFITCTVTGSHILVAISKTGDPTGSWTKYAFDTWGLDPNNAANTLSGSMVLRLVFSFNGLRIFFVGSTESQRRNRRSCAEQTAEQTAELSAEQSGGMQVDWGWVSDGWGTQAG